MAYLTEESGTAGTGTTCQVHLLDRDRGRSGDLPCPAELAAASDTARPHFSADGAALEWSLPGEANPVRLANPLMAVSAVITR